MSDLWRQGFAAFNLTPDETQKRQLAAYTAELLRVNRKMNLVRAEDEETLLRRHVFDALSALPILGKNGPAAAADVGSGCGIPAIPLAVFWPETRFTLIERSEKRASFLRYAAAVCGLTPRVTVENRELETIGETFDLVTLRAFRHLDEFIGPLMAVTRAGGRIAAYKGRREAVDEDLTAAGLASALVQIKTLDNPFYDAERHLLLIRKS